MIFDNITISYKKFLYLLHFKFQKITLNLIYEYTNRVLGLVCPSYLNNKIFLNLKNIEKDIEYRNFNYNCELDFYEYICQIISHETIHLLCFELSGVNACKKYDNIKNKLRKNGYLMS